MPHGKKQEGLLWMIKGRAGPILGKWFHSLPVKTLLEGAGCPETIMAPVGGAVMFKLRQRRPEEALGEQHSFFLAAAVMRAAPGRQPFFSSVIAGFPLLPEFLWYSKQVPLFLCWGIDDQAGCVCVWRGGGRSMIKKWVLPSPSLVPETRKSR